MALPIAAIAIPAAVSLIKFMMEKNAQEGGLDAQIDALQSAQEAIQGAADKGMAYQQPYLENAGEDYRRQRGLVQGGYYTQPYTRSFQMQPFQGQSASFDPSQGGQMSFARPQQGGLLSFSPAALPSREGYYTQAPPQAAPQPTQGRGMTPLREALDNAINAGNRSVLPPYMQNPYINRGAPNQPNKNPWSAYSPTGGDVTTMQTLLEQLLGGRMGGGSGPTVPTGGGLMGGR